MQLASPLVRAAVTLEDEACAPAGTAPAPRLAADLVPRLAGARGAPRWKSFAPPLIGAAHRRPSSAGPRDAPMWESGANRGRRARRLVMSPDCGLGLVPAVGVECRGGGGDGVEGGLGVDGQADRGQDSRVGGEVPVHRRFTGADGGLPELASSPVPSVHQLRVVLRGVSPLSWRRLRRENGVRPAGQPYPDATPSLRAARGTYPTDPEVASTADPGTSEPRGQGGIRLLKIT